MGYHSSPTIAFMMTLFNVRLGAWLGNTNAQAAARIALRGPRTRCGRCLGELFGFTTPLHLT